MSFFVKNTILKGLLRQQCGVPISVFNYLISYLEPYKNEFRTFSIREALTLTLSHLRMDATFSQLQPIVNKDREDHVSHYTISLTIRKIVYILAGVSPYEKPSDEDLGLDADEASEKCYYKSDSFKTLRKSPCGAFCSSHLGWNVHDIDDIFMEGISAFDKCRQLDYHKLKDLGEDQTG